MKIEDLEKHLKELGMTKKEFSQKTGVAYQTIINWAGAEKLPAWVESWIENYKLAQKYKTIVSLIEV